jgi:hypothetical protein
MTVRLGLWGRYSGRDPEKEIYKLKQRFQAVSRRSFHRRPPRWLRQPDWPSLWTVGALVALTLFIGWRWFWDSNMWPASQVLLQRTYVRDCAEARRIGIAPLYSGYAGYRESLDRDRDGIACEPYPF